MPITVAAAFDAFFDGINLPGDHREVATKRASRIVEVVGAKLHVLDGFATGSVPRYTALREHADLDVVVALHGEEHIKGRSPSEVLLALRASLAGYRTALRRNGQAVTLFYETWPSVDVVPVSRSVSSNGSVNYYSIPDMTTEKWLVTRPRNILATSRIGPLRAVLCSERSSR